MLKWPGVGQKSKNIAPLAQQNLHQKYNLQCQLFASRIQSVYIPILPDKTLPRVISQPSKTTIPELIRTYFQNRLCVNILRSPDCNPKIAVCKDKTAVRIAAPQKIVAAGWY